MKKLKNGVFVRATLAMVLASLCGCASFKSRQAQQEQSDQQAAQPTVDPTTQKIDTLTQSLTKAQSRIEELEAKIAAMTDQIESTKLTVDNLAGPKNVKTQGVGSNDDGVEMAAEATKAEHVEKAHAAATKAAVVSAAPVESPSTRSDVIQEYSSQESYAAMKAKVMHVVGKHFRPEFLNRVDEAVVFRPLGEAQIVQICEIQLERLKSRLAAKDLSIDISKDAMQKLTEVGYDPVYGARPLKRALQQYIENPLAQELLAGSYKPGATIKVKLDKDGGFKFT